MPTPMEICLEDLDLSPEDERYIRCVALPGGEPGLALDSEGLVRWMPGGPAAYGLWVSADDRLVLQRAESAGPITVRRGGRSLDAPAASPVVLLDGDQLQVNGRRLRVHVHGVAEEVHAPEPLTLGRLARTAAAALAIGAMVGGASDAAAHTPGIAGVGAPPPVEVRRRPPKPAPPRRRVVCSVTSMKVKQGIVVVRATCPEQLHVNAWGQILDAKGQPMKDGHVVVKKVKGDAIEAHASSLKRPVKATKVQFRVY